MTREEYNDFANALKNNYTIDFDKLPEFCDMAISVLSADGEYIKKADILNELGDVNMDILTDEVKETVNSLPSYSFPDSAENKGEWIPVSERLPETHHDILLELRSGNILTGFKAETEPYFYCHGVDGYYVEPQNVIAWQPLPEPYKAEKGGE